MTRPSLSLRAALLRTAAGSLITLSGFAVMQLPSTAQAAEAAETATDYAVTIAVPHDPPASTPVDITGAVTPAAAAEDVLLQRQLHGKFATIATTELDGQSHYSFTRSFGTAGGYTLRVLKPAGDGYAQGVSQTVRMWVTSDTLQSGHTMLSGDMLLSANGMYRLLMRPNGNLELDLASNGRYLWSSRTGGHPGSSAILQRDGDLVVHGPDGTALADTGSGGHADGVYSMALNDDGELVISNPGKSALWSSDSVNDTLAVDEELKPGQFVTSPNLRYQAIMQANGTFAVYDTVKQATIWDSYTAVANSTATMQDDGNLVVRGPLGKPLWSSRTPGNSGAHAVMQDDGNLVIYQAGKAIWGSAGINGVLGDDYPTSLRSADRDSLIDPWRFYNRECVSFVAWRLNHTNHVDFSNFMDGGRFGNANTWDDNARKLGYTVNHTPAPGAVAQTDAGSYGHVAWVAAVGDGTVTIEDYNYSAPGEYGVRTVPTSSYNYIHIKDLS